MPTLDYNYMNSGYWPEGSGKGPFWVNAYSSADQQHWYDAFYHSRESAIQYRDDSLSGYRIKVTLK